MSELSTLENVLESLSGQITGLHMQKKQLESRIKELRGEVEVAELDAARKIADAQARADADIRALQETVAPHRDLASRIKSQQSELATLRRTMETETMRLQAERHHALSALDAKIVKASERLSKLQAEEEAFRKRIALV